MARQQALCPRLGRILAHEGEQHLAAAEILRRETGCAVEQLTMIMDGPDDQLENYYDALLANAKAVIDGFAGEELVK